MPAQKIAIFGPPLAGKTTILSAYARSRGLNTTSGPAHFTANKIAPPRHVLTGKAEEHAQAATYAGAVWTIVDWEPLLQACDAVLVVLDSQDTRMDANLVHVQFLRETRLNVKGCFLFSKSDLSSSLPAEEIRRHLALHDDYFRDWPSYESTIQDPDTLLTPFEYLLGG